MKNFILLGISLMLACAGWSQFSMSDAGFPQNNPMDCNVYSDGSAQNWFDQGGAGNYGPNYNDTIVICPDLTLGTKATIVFAINAGFSFNVDPSDTIYVFDGPDVTYPLLGAHNSGTDPNGFTHQATWNNPTGCLTVVFVTDGANEAAGWVGNVTCGSPNQPFEVHMEAYVNNGSTNELSPLDTGFVDVCLGDSILLVATPLFPYSMETTGYGYSQNLTNVVYDWNISGSGASFPNNDSIWFVPPTRSGFLVDLKITDIFPQSYRIVSKVRVSILPIFAGTGPLEDTVCLGQQTELIGGVTPTDTVGTVIPGGEFNLGGAFAGLTYLPDGSGAQYQAPVSITGFPNGATITNGTDLNQVCITMEHTFLGDLEIALQCPNGTTVSLVNSYSPGFIPGGFGGGGTFLGDADDLNGNGVPGIGWTYCFSTLFNDFQTMGAELAAGNTVPTTVTPGNQSMNPNGVYLPDGNFNDFIGCPVNGDWTIIVQDNLGIDDGYIFEWGLYFDPSLQPGLAGYQNVVVSDFWTNDPTIVSGQSDTAIVVIPTTPGAHGYTYNVTDDFGCSYDTTVILYTLPQPTIFPDTLACYQNFNVQGTTAYNGGVWSAVDTCIHFNPSANVLNPSIWTTVPGTYTVTFTDNACGTVLTAEIYYPPTVYTQVLDTVICVGSSYIINALQSTDIQNYTWSTGESGPSIAVASPGSYIVTVSNECYSYSDTATIGTKVCDIQVPNIITLSSLTGNNIFFVEYEGVSEFECTIVNRWGNTIYEYNDPAGAWDGRTKSGDFVEDGTYFYIIKAKLESGEELTKQGFVQVYK